VHVARLKAAGAVILGKTNTPEFGYKGFTENDLFGATRNPWDPTKTPGGSSGGSASAVAGGMVAVCSGSDGGGSIRIPAAFCGCYGIKPSAGRIPLAGDTYPHWATHSTLGPLTRTVRDAGRYLDVAAGAHPNDLNSLDSEFRGYEAAVLAEPPRLRRIAWSEDLGYAAVDPEVARVARAAAEALAKAVGAELVDANPGFDNPIVAWLNLGAPGDAHFVDEMTEAQRALLEHGFVAFSEIGRQVSGVQMADALQVRHRINRQMTAFFETYDALLTPTCADVPFIAEGPPPSSIGGKPVGPAGFIPFTYPFNLTGHPAASLPAGLARGLPVGLQVVGPRYQDAFVLAVSAAFESARPWAWPA
jgi:aspartyl-tRNA(Asn)/glutamyl-tRNA(Gln) amidotransferase subunit A